MDAIKGQGMLWVTSRISKESQDVLDEPTFLKWYDEDHIAEVSTTSGIRDAFRYVDVEKDSAPASKPFLAFYPMPDLAFTQGEEFRKIRVKSDMLPGSGIIYDMADMDVSYLGLVGKTNGENRQGPADYLLVSAIEPAEGASDDEVNGFYDKQLETVSKSPNYLRSLRFKLLYTRTNAQSRALKGLDTTDEPNPEPPTWQVVHEFTRKPDDETRKVLLGTQDSFLQRAKQNEVRVYQLAKVHGGGRFFE
ncbi:hypothetical protein M011DRAFT_451025 [Sporormia fimetaria CBS 119925]|uniref:Uncharacterized protein n=1 Tax=Sporormia fimetaria CBS 119925 TaxID=1340428 RepID=A0A6A6UZ18_9PLEO|nr:hypothetical protein M011DRAFT_451025 [Sporormia fimetaria CBS 119925]